MRRFYFTISRTPPEPSPWTWNPALDATGQVMTASRPRLQMGQHAYFVLAGAGKSVLPYRPLNDDGQLRAWIRRIGRSSSGSKEMVWSRLPELGSSPAWHGLPSEGSPWYGAGKRGSRSSWTSNFLIRQGLILVVSALGVVLDSRGSCRGWHRSRSRTGGRGSWRRGQGALMPVLVPGRRVFRGKGLSG